MQQKKNKKKKNNILLGFFKNFLFVKFDSGEAPTNWFVCTHTGFFFFGFNLMLFIHALYIFLPLTNKLLDAGNSIAIHNGPTMRFIIYKFLLLFRS
jgi:hypothetical protein